MGDDLIRAGQREIPVLTDSDPVVPVRSAHFRAFRLQWFVDVVVVFHPRESRDMFSWRREFGAFPKQTKAERNSEGSGPEKSDSDDSGFWRGAVLLQCRPATSVLGANFSG